MIMKDRSGVHSMGMYNSRCIKFPMAVLAMYVYIYNGEVIRMEDDYADGTSSTKKTCYMTTVKVLR